MKNVIKETNQYLPGQLSALVSKLKSGKVKNRYAVKNKIKKIKKTQAHNEWLAR